jgi:hypothetical protein
VRGGVDPVRKSYTGGRATMRPGTPRNVRNRSGNSAGIPAGFTAVSRRRGDQEIEPQRTAEDRSNCLRFHAAVVAMATVEGFHRCLVRTMKFRMVRSFRMQATRATFFGFPAVRSRW